MFEKIQTQKEYLLTMWIYLQRIYQPKRYSDRQQKSRNFVARTKEIEKEARKIRGYFGSDHRRICTLPFF